MVNPRTEEKRAKRRRGAFSSLTREWCEDKWHDSYKEDAPTNGSAWIEGGSAFRVGRGGCWLDGAGRCRSAFRAGWHPDFRYDYVGFRPASSSPGNFTPSPPVRKRRP